MYIDSIVLERFRNIFHSKVCFSQGVNVIFGRNGEGKTNLLEAIFLLSAGRSFRRAKGKDLILSDSLDAALFAEAHDTLGKFSISALLASTGKAFAINGHRASSLSDFLGRLVTVTFSPGDLQLVQGSPSCRRSFLDKHIIDLQPQLLNNYLNFQRAIHHKKKVFDAGSFSRREIEPWNIIIASEGIAILRAHRNQLKEISTRANAGYKTFSNNDVRLRFDLLSNCREVDSSEMLFKKLNDSFDREQAAKRCLIGPHRDDFQIFLGEKNDARLFASQGQARSIVLALKMAAIEIFEVSRLESPVILLDDFSSELDLVRRRLFLEQILGTNRQVIVTCTERNGFPESAWFIEVDRGSYFPHKDREKTQLTH